MPFVLRSSVRWQLTVSILLAIVLSWLLSAATSYSLIRQDILALRREMLAHPETYPVPIPEPRFTLVDFLVGFPRIAPDRLADRQRPPRPRTDGAERPPPPPDRPDDMAPPPPPDGERADRPPPPDAQGRPRGAPPADDAGVTLANVLARVGIMLALALATGLVLGARFTRSLRALARGARSFHRGEFTHRIPLAGDDEFCEVAASMNDMAGQVARQIDELTDDARRRQHLLADVAHELRGPVMTLRTMAGALEEGLATDPARHARAVDSLVHTSDRLLHLVTDLLELAKLDLQELPMHPQPVDLRALAQGVLQAQAAVAQRAQITLQPVETGPPVMVTADPDRLTQVLDNLVGNAIAHAGAGATVRIDCVDGDPVRLDVADTGQGIAPAHLPFLFDAFYRADAARSPRDGHSGLGLRIARALVQAHHGTLTLASTPGQGTTATLTLPRG